MAQETTTVTNGTEPREDTAPSQFSLTSTTQTPKINRVQRRRAELLDRMCGRLGYVRDYEISVGPQGITGYIRAPARLVRHSLAPVLRARDIDWTTDSRESRRDEGLITIRLSDARRE